MAWWKTVWCKVPGNKHSSHVSGECLYLLACTYFWDVFIASCSSGSSIGVAGHTGKAAEGRNVDYVVTANAFKSVNKAF